MTLIKSISGIRGTIGGNPGDNLTPVDIVKFVSAYAAILKETTSNPVVVVGRDARMSGAMVNHLVCGTLVAGGVDVIDLGLSTTPTVELAVPGENADAGIILTASHNPAQWNALKLLNNKGEFISAEDGKRLLEIAEQGAFEYAEIDKIGSISMNSDWIDRHIQMVVDYPLVSKNSIAQKGLKVAVDAVNSTGGIAIPRLLKALGVNDVIEVYCTPDGRFPHNPEPLPEHLTELCKVVKEQNCDLGIVVDPDVDRLCFVDENGVVFGEEYTLVAVADLVLSKKGAGSTVSNLSSTRALSDVTRRHGGSYTASAVGEVNVVEEMKSRDAVIGGEGNGGIIVPDFHYGRDALIGVGLFLTLLAEKGLKTSELRATYPNYAMKKDKIQLTPELDVDGILKALELKFEDQRLTTIDGLKIDMENGWVHLRKSNTEPIIRLYAEGVDEKTAAELSDMVRQAVNDHLNQSGN